MKTDKSCADCCYVENVNLQVLECRRNAPHPLVMQGQGLDGRAVPVVIGTFPMMRPDHWCAKFQSKSNLEPHKLM